MRTYADLSPAEQAQARELALVNLLKAVLEGGLRINGLQTKINAAMRKAEQMQTPWFAHEYIMDEVGDRLQGIAESDAKRSLYLEPGEHVVRLPKGE